MPKLRSKPPKYCKHKASGQAVVTLDGRDLYLGPWRSRASLIEYDRLIGEWLENGRRLPHAGESDLTITELAAAYWRYAKSYYVKNGQPTATIAGIRVALRWLRQSYKDTQAADFGPLALKAVRSRMVEAGQSRRYVNDNVDRIRRMFRWAAAEELLPVCVPQSLAALAGLRKGRTEARETVPVRPVEEAVIEATLPYLTATVAAMVRLQRLTGCRPSEVCMLRPCDVGTSGEVWSYHPDSHKTEHHGRERVIFIGPKAQDVLRPYLLRDTTAYCFVPAESERKRNAVRREARQTPITPSQRRRWPKPKRRRAPGEKYTTQSYRRAIHRACDKTGIERWSPNRLRHAAASEIRARFGLEAAQVALGHSQANVTQVYAERDMSLAAEVMARIG